MHWSCCALDAESNYTKERNMKNKFHRSPSNRFPNFSFLLYFISWMRNKYKIVKVFPLTRETCKNVLEFEIVQTLPCKNKVFIITINIICFVVSGWVKSQWIVVARIVHELSHFQNIGQGVTGWSELSKILKISSKYGLKDSLIFAIKLALSVGSK